MHVNVYYRFSVLAVNIETQPRYWDWDWIGI